MRFQVTLYMGQDTDYWCLLPSRTGYECTGYEVVGNNPRCVDVELAEGLRNTDSIKSVFRFVRCIARTLGSATLKLRYTPVGSEGNGNTVIIEITVGQVNDKHLWN